MILVFGHICMELQASINQASIKFPCSITANSDNIKIGGNAANQAIAAARSGAKTSLIGIIGNDLFGQNILNCLRHEGIQSSGIIKSTEKPTGVINSIINKNGAPAKILLSGANSEIKSDLITDSSLNERVMLLLQDDLPNEINLKIIQRSNKKGAISIICFNSAQNIDDSLLNSANISIINDNGNVIINKTHGTKLEIFENFNSFCATFAAAKQAGLTMQRAIEYGNAAASLDASKGFPYLDDIKSKLDKNH